MFLFTREERVERKAPEPGKRLAAVYFDAADVPGAHMSMAEVRFPPGELGPLHEHEHEVELYYCLEGEGTVICAGTAFRLSKGAALYVPPKTPHETRNDGPGDFVFLAIFAPCMPLSAMRSWKRSE